MTKKCGNCKLDKPLSEFNNASKGLHNKQSYCKVCALEKSKTWASTNRGIVNERARNHSKKLSYRYKTAQRAATRRGYEFELTFEQFQQLNLQDCTYCKGRLGVLSGSGLDRLDNTKNYTIDNVVPCCVVCNKIRNVYLTPEETHKVIQFLLGLRGLA